jgi:hypothetical protein
MISRSESEDTMKLPKGITMIPMTPNNVGEVYDAIADAVGEPRGPLIPEGVKHVVSAPQRFGHTFRTRCKCGWYYEGSSMVRCEQRGTEHLKENME